MKLQFPPGFDPPSLPFVHLTIPSLLQKLYCSVCGESQSKKMKHYAAKPIFLCLFSEEIASRAFNTKTP